jgi:hypothetical protein
MFVLRALAHRACTPSRLSCDLRLIARPSFLIALAVALTSGALEQEQEPAQRRGEKIAGSSANAFRAR